MTIELVLMIIITILIWLTAFDLHLDKTEINTQRCLNNPESLNYNFTCTLVCNKITNRCHIEIIEQNISSQTKDAYRELIGETKE